MEKKEVFTVAVGLMVIIFIASWVIYGTGDIAESTTVASEGMNTVLLQQRDLVIKKLMKQSEAKDAALVLAKNDVAAAEQEVVSAKKELAVSNDKLETIKAVVR